MFLSNFDQIAPLKHGMNINKTEHELHENSNFQWLQLINFYSRKMKFVIKETNESTRILTLDKLSSTEIYILTS